MPMGTYWVIQGGEHGGLGGLMARPPELPTGTRDHWGVYFTVADLDRKIGEVTVGGGSLLFGPDAVEGVGRFATVADPQGGAFQIIQPPAG
ncbi:MAG: hypothetical protein ACT4P1_09970 [Sporichthyaceae bacterium]